MINKSVAKNVGPRGRKKKGLSISRDTRRECQGKQSFFLFIFLRNKRRERNRLPISPNYFILIVRY